MLKNSIGLPIVLISNMTLHLHLTLLNLIELLLATRMSYTYKSKIKNLLFSLLVNKHGSESETYKLILPILNRKVIHNFRP